MHPLVVLAKKAVEAFVREHDVIPSPGSPTPEMQEQAGVFVSIKKHGQLRGCIGTFMPATENVASEIIRNAMSAATQDPRFSPVSTDELGELDYSVDLLSPPERVSSSVDLDPQHYGIILVSGHRKGLLLPALEGVDTVEEQMRITRMKAGIMPSDPVEIFRFRVRRYR